ncbi:MAG: YabP/YqfC family sporulation protein [Clostridia bacterium]|nr:YabP/YqfC family sporulation protein [Clostridia bacterium]
METTDYLGNDIHIFDRSKAEVTGVSEVLSFSNSGITVSCKIGTVSFDGDGLKILSFDSASGKLYISGRVDSVYYYDDNGDKRTKHRFFG